MIAIERKKLEQVLDDLICASSYCNTYDAIDVIKEALAQPEQEPVAVVYVRPLMGNEAIPQTRIEWKNGRPVAGPLYTTPPKRPWVGLTDEQIWKFWSSRPEVPEGEDDSMEAEFVAAVRRVLAAHGIGAKLKEKNT